MDARGDELKVHWFLPTGGDSRELVAGGEGGHWRDAGYDELLQVARAADHLGFEGMLTPAGSYCEDAWIATALLASATRRVKFLVAFRPGLLSPTLAAQMAATYQHLTGGRLLLNVVTGAEPAELARFGDFADKDTRYARTAEFLQVVQGAWGPEPFDFAGEHYTVEGATVRVRPKPAPDIYFGGASPAAEAVAAAHVDVYLTWGEPPAMAAERVERMRARADEHGRTLRFGIRFHAIARPTADAAWAEAERLLAAVPAEAIDAAQADFARTQSEGQRRMASLHRGDAGNLEIHPNVWAGVGLVRGGAGTALVGSYEDVADRIEEYASVGFSEFILSGYPHLEEAYHVGEGVLPVLRERGRLAPLTGAGASPPMAQFR